ncbi:IclR family transcriptional regulator C-terminal domain-containing protein [Streptomyces sp. Da 82-17]|uniref:IclR family transcriptional regulator domain-containing protein n=1 Tax=Streptomyces sp. Da 82-17 TaxID=3377116 RepID=UPI0038D3F983
MSRYDEGRGDDRAVRTPTAPEVPPGLDELIDALTGPPDHWDRPDGDFGPHSGAVRQDRSVPPGLEARRRANALYRLGSRALGRGELAAAADWLGDAAACGHPGALFRLAVVALRAGADWGHEAWFLVAEAARLGHGDAARLLRAHAHRRPDTDTDPDSDVATPRVEDGTYFDEARRLLGVEEELLMPDQTGDSVRELGAGRGGGRAPRLFLVPPPPLPPLARGRREQAAGTDDSAGLGARTGPAEVPALWLPDPAGPAHPARPVAAVPGADGGSPEGPSGEPWWSANALRPAVLNDMARHSPALAPKPRAWQAALRARDLLHLIDGADGIDTRTLAQRTRMSLNTTVRFLDWLRDQHLITTVGGAHRPGPLLRATGAPDRDLLRRALADLRDELDAAVYLSSYVDGEIRIHEAAYSRSAPPVDEWAPFSDTGHASAVGKCLLAQLDFDTRMEHLARHPSVQLTERTITDPRDLVERLDGHGPHAAQFDLLEYSRTEVCVAYSLGLPGRASGIALSLPARDHGRLIPAARSLSRRATGILLAHLVTEASTGTARESTDRAHPPARRALP